MGEGVGKSVGVLSTLREINFQPINSEILVKKYKISLLELEHFLTRNCRFLY